MSHIVTYRHTLSLTVTNCLAMSSNIKIIRTCELCKKEFTARTLHTRYCSHECNSKHYKVLTREKKIEEAVGKDSEPMHYDSDVNVKQFLSIEETAMLLGASRRTIHRLIADKKIKVGKLGSRTIIKRQFIDNLFK